MIVERLVFQAKYGKADKLVEIIKEGRKLMVRNGYPDGRILTDLTSWMEEKEYDSVEQLKGSMSRENCPNPSELDRANYMKALVSFTAE